MIWLVTGFILLALGILAAIMLLRRAPDIEEMILQGRPILLRCGKMRVEGRAPGCALEDPHSPCC